MSEQAPFEVKPFLRSLTHRPGVYRMLDAKHKVLYVGKARDLKKRVSTYFQRSSMAVKTAAMMEQVARVEVTVVVGCVLDKRLGFCLERLLELW